MRPDDKVFYLCSFLTHNFNNIPGSASGKLKYMFYISNLVAESMGLKLGQILCNLRGLVNLSTLFPFPQK